jgi:hypothetical protein
MQLQRCDKFSIAQSRRTNGHSDAIIVKTIKATEISHICKFVQISISYKKYSDHFHVGLTKISVIQLAPFC